MPQALSLLRHPMVALSHFLAHFSASSSRWTSTWGMIGACIYFASFAFPLQGNIPLLGFALCSTLAIAASTSVRTPGWTLLTLAIVAFIGATAVSTLVSVDLGRSLRLSTPFLPAVLLFFVATAHCEGTRDIRRLYLMLSAVGLGLATMGLWGVWARDDGITLNALVPRLGLPILVVPNDLTVLAVIAPLSLVLLCREPRGVIGLFAAASIFLSLCTICIFRSRTAAVTIMVSLTCACLLTQRRRRLLLSLASVLGVLLLALSLNALFFPDSQLVTKIVSRWGSLGRTAYWETAWRMFCEAPWLGHGPHTFGLFHKTPWAHNLYLEVLAEQGLLGLLALGSLLICGLVGGWRLRRAQTEDGRLLGAGAFAGLVGFCAAGVVELTLLREWVVTMLFMLLGVIGHLVSRQPQQGRAQKNGLYRLKGSRCWSGLVPHAVHPRQGGEPSVHSPIPKRRESTMEYPRTWLARWCRSQPRRSNPPEEASAAGGQHGKWQRIN